MAPFIANNTAGIDSYKWMLFGDDDTVFYVDNILRMLETLDHTMPYILSDHIWFPTDLESRVPPDFCVSCWSVLLLLLVTADHA